MRHLITRVFPILLAALAVSCTRPAPEPVDRARLERVPFDPRAKAETAHPALIRLDDLSAGPSFSADPMPQEAPQKSWSFADGAAGWTFPDGGVPGRSGDGLSWSVGPGREGVVSPPLDLPFRDLRAIEVRLSAASGRQLRLWWSGGEGFDRKFSIASEIRPGADPLRYSVRTATLRGFEGLRLDRLRVDPTDGAEANVSVLSIALIGREGSYAGRGHGVGQEMLDNVVRNVLFHRAPSEISWDLTVPEGGRLDAGAGLLEARDGVLVTVRIESGKKRTEILRRRIADDAVWHDFGADLSRWAGRKVRLVLAAESSFPGHLVLWSNPLVSGSASRARPNVLVYLIDTLRADRLGAYGNRNATSPALDRLAGEGVLFERSSAAASWTRPSVASLLTSLAPPSHGVTDHGLAVSDAVVTLAEQMRQAGYVTAGFLTSTHAGSSANLQQGYDFLYELPAVAGDARLIEQGRRKDFSKKNSEMVNRVVFPWLERYGDLPFFAYLHAMDPHAPYLPPAPYDRMFATGYAGPITGGFEEEDGFERARSREELDHVLSLYDGDIRFNDDRIGELVDRLRAAGTLDRTLLVVTSDHGEEFFEHGGFEHGQSLHAELLDVPLIMRLPGALPAGRRVAERVSGLDVMPTILRLAGIEPNPDVQGRSLLDLVGAAEGERAGGGPAVFAWRLEGDGGEEVSVERGAWKAIVRPDGSVGLYDRAADPAERTDRAGGQTERARRLAEEGRGWLSGLARITVPGEEARVTVDAEEREWLEALGYIR